MIYASRLMLQQITSDNKCEVGSNYKRTLDLRGDIDCQWIDIKCHNHYGSARV
jgi:hypothetical protein